jgi:molybdate transport system regulatory protein
VKIKGIHSNKEIIPNKNFRGRIWINGKKSIFIGYGRVALLENIGKYGSITKAAKSMKMAYRRAWYFVDSMNRMASRPLVITETGGKGGGGAYLTEDGKKAIKVFRKLHDDFQDFLKHEERLLILK